MTGDLLPYTAALADMDRESAALADMIPGFVEQGDYSTLEQSRRFIGQCIANLKLLADELEQAVIKTLPPEGAVIDGRNTEIDHPPAGRRFTDDDKRRLARDVVQAQLGVDPTNTATGEAIAAILRVFPLGDPRVTVLPDYDLKWWDYGDRKAPPAPKVKVAK